MAVLLGAIKHNVDEIKLREVILFAENDRYLYDILMNTYVPAVKKKVKSGKYNKTLATKLLEYYYTNYVRREMIKPSKYGYDPKLNPEERKRFGEYFRDVIESEYL